MAGKRKRRQHLSQTQNLTNNRGITVPSSSNSPLVVIFAFLPSKTVSHAALVITHEQETYGLVILWFFE